MSDLGEQTQQVTEDSKTKKYRLISQLTLTKASSLIDTYVSAQRAIAYDSLTRKVRTSVLAK
jgi:hypothetical protein